MADKLITIGYPTIIPPAYFEVKYRLIGSTWNDLPPQDNTPFTITGLGSGLYELSIVYVTPNGEECDAVITQFLVPSVACECPEFDVVLSRCHKQNIINIGFYPTNICGVTVEYTIDNGSFANSSNIVEFVPPIPTYYEIPIQFPQVTNVKIKAKCCSTGEWIVCYDAPPSAVNWCICETAQLITAESIVWNGIDPTAIINFMVTNSNPSTLAMPLLIYQDNVTTPNTMAQEISPDAGGTNYSFTMPVVPFDGALTFVIKTISEVCGVVESFVVYVP